MRVCVCVCVWWRWSTKTDSHGLHRSPCCPRYSSAAAPMGGFKVLPWSGKSRCGTPRAFGPTWWCTRSRRTLCWRTSPFETGFDLTVRGNPILPPGWLLFRTNSALGSGFGALEFRLLLRFHLGIPVLPLARGVETHSISSETTWCHASVLVSGLGTISFEKLSVTVVVASGLSWRPEVTIAVRNACRFTHRALGRRPCSRLRPNHRSLFQCLEWSDSAGGRRGSCGGCKGHQVQRPM